MWVIVQGIGAADSVWGAALHYIQRGGVIFQANTGQIGMENGPVVLTAGGILKSEACMLTVYNALVSQQAGAPAGSLPPVPNFTPSKPIISNGQGTIHFPGNITYAGVLYQGICGKVKWATSTDAGATDNSKLDSRSIAVNQMVLDLLPLANSLAQIIVPPQSGQYGTISGTDLPPGMLLGAAQDYIGIMQAWLHSPGGSQQSAIDAFVKKAESQGWVTAGAYYYNFANVVMPFAAENQAPETTYPGSYNSGNFPPEAASQLTANISPIVAEKLGCPSNASELPAWRDTGYPLDYYICKTFADLSKGHTPGTIPSSFAQIPQTNANTFEQMGVSWLIAEHFPSIINPIIALINQIISAIVTQLNNIITGVYDPIIALQALGLGIIGILIAGWTVAGVATGVATFLTSVVSMGAVPALIFFYVSIFSMLSVALFGAAVLMAYYVPLIPAILFFSTVIGWFIIVIEAMVAAPLVALGAMSPEGPHPIFGQAQPAIMLLLNVFMRPTLIIVGFVFAMILERVSIWLFNIAVYTFLTNIFQSGVATGVVMALSLIGFVPVYGTIVIYLINKSFSLIHEVPNKVIRWIGGQPEHAGEGEMLEQAKGTVQRGGSAAQGALEKSSDKTASARTEAKDKAQKAKNKEASLD
jgi:hypothetical protein